MTDHYILDEDGNPKLIETWVSCGPDDAGAIEFSPGEFKRMDDAALFRWGRWMEDGNRRIVKSTVMSRGLTVSTVFLGIDHNWGDGPPILWETMIFGGEGDGYQDRYSSLKSALAGHDHAIALMSEAGYVVDPDAEEAEKARSEREWKELMKRAGELQSELRKRDG